MHAGADGIRKGEVIRGQVFGRVDAASAVRAEVCERQLCVWCDAPADAKETVCRVQGLEFRF